MDTYYFYVPLRILWTHAREFFGENKDSAWLPTVEYSIPTITPPSGGWNVGTVADYLGIPVGTSVSSGINKGISALPFRAYAMIADEWFRDQNLTDPLVINFGDSTTTGTQDGNPTTDPAKGGYPFKVAKYHDYFTSCLPQAQKSDPVGLFGNIIGSTNPVRNYVPVYTLGNATKPFINQTEALRGKNFGQTATGVIRIDTDSSVPSKLVFDDSGAASTIPSYAPINLWANVGELNLSINQLRLAFQLQKFFEKNARAGTRYRELIKEHFGVTSSDARMMIPEYLGGHRFPLSIHQVANQSQGESDFLGDLGAMSNTADINEDFIKSFEEHGFVIGVCCVRYDHSYPQGLERFWRRSLKTDYYWPVFANIGEQPVYKTEIMLNSSQNGTEVFGYQEAWAEYRYKPSRVSGEMRPGVSNSLATWHLSDYYSAVPSLSDSWIREDKANVDRVLSVTSSVAHQVFADFYVNNICTRPMPMYSVPGLIDHH